MKKVLITGATGFVGFHLSEYLSKSSEFEIFGTSLSTSSPKDESNIKIEKINLTVFDDVLNLVKKVRPDHIYHLAALTSPSESFNNPTPVVLSNIEMQMNLLNAVKQTELGSTRILIVSSAEVYGMIGREDLPVDEDTKFRPGNPYAVSKIAQDFLGLQYNLSYKMDIVRVRPFNHTGPGQAASFAIPAFAKQIATIEKGQKELVLKVGNLTAKRDFTDVRDIVRGYVGLMERGKSGDVYNIGSGKSQSMQELLDKLLALTDTKIGVQVDQEKMRPVEVLDSYCDYTKLNSLTDWKPVIPIEATLQDTLDYWRSVV